jgi:putative transposase
MATFAQRLSSIHHGFMLLSLRTRKKAGGLKSRFCEAKLLRAKESGLWERIMDALVMKTRFESGKAFCPTYAIVDSQSVKTTLAAQDRGVDGGKKIKGRKRHIAIDTMGNMLSIKVHAANIHDTNYGALVLSKAKKKYQSIRGVCGDAGYLKTFEEQAREIVEKVDVVKRSQKGWIVLPKRWLVERTFSWLNHSRRLSKDYEISVSSAENMVMVSHLATLLRRY